MFERYAKAWAGAIGMLIATAGVAYTGGDLTSIESSAALIGGGLATVFAVFGPKNAPAQGMVEMTEQEAQRLRDAEAKLLAGRDV